MTPQPRQTKVINMKTTKTTRAAKMIERKAQKARAEAVGAACMDEISRLNQAIVAGAVVTIKVATYTEPLQVSMVDANFLYYTPKANGGFGFHWHGCNDGQWAEMLRMAGVPRNPLFTK